MDDLYCTYRGTGPAGATQQSLAALLDDQSGCWRRGDRLLVEAYLEMQPALREDPDKVLDLIYHEILLRSQAGEVPTLREYLHRFPQYAGPLRAQFDVHQAMLLGDALLSASPADAADSAPGAAPVVSGYEVLEELGRGGMGVVYKARHVGMKRLVALKMLQPGAGAGPEQLARFRTEVEALGRLEHPNIIRIYEVGEHQGRPYFALEFVPGGSLEEKLRGVPLPARQAAALAETLARAIHAAHESRIVHRDLKPANVLLASGGREPPDPTEPSGGSRPPLAAQVPKITDFGLAKQLDADSVKTRSGDILGTPSYMAPEQAHGKNHAVGPRTDVYSLGAVLYEMLTGRPPFQGETVWDTLEQVVKKDPVPPRSLQPRLPRDLETICLKCLHKEPARRYATAADLAEDLRRFLGGEPIRGRPTPAWERAWKWLRRRPARAAAGATALVLGAALVVAHYAHLRAALTRAEAQAAAAEVERLLDAVSTQVNARNWQEARALLHDHALENLARAQDSFPGCAQLDRLRERAGRAEEQIERHLTDQERLAQFRLCRLEAGFQATAFGGLDPDSRRRRTRAAAEAAFRLFHAVPESPGGPALDGPLFTDAERREVREGCCELLLELADVTADAAPRETALSLLDRAEALGVATPLIAWRRARYAAGAGPNAGGELPHHSRAFEFFLRGNDLCRAGRLPQAIEHFERAVTRQSDHFGAHYALAVCYLKSPAPQKELRRGNLRLARLHLAECVEQQPERVWPYLQRGLAHGELDDAEAAEADFASAERLLSQAPDETALYALLVNRGVSRIQRHNPEGAVADLTRAVHLKPEEFPAYLNLARAYQDQGNGREAVAQLDQATTLNVPSALAAIYRSRARLHQQQHDLGAAIRDLELAVRHHPDGPDSPAAAADRLLLGRLLLQDGRPKEALAAADAAVSAAPDTSAGQRLRAEALLQLERHAEAAQALDRYLAADRTDAAAYLARARARAAGGEHAAAADDYTCALELAPGTAAVHAARGWNHLALDAPVLALRDFDQALRLDPEGGDAHNGRGYALVKTGRYREAVQDAEKALRLGPRQPRTLCNAARIFAQAASKREADPAEQTLQGREVRLRHLDRAAELLREALEQLPAEQRSAFWKHNIARDAALTPLRPCAAFVRLAETYGAASP
jgi:tetratricopeptide (TPR) repeat protein